MKNLSPKFAIDRTLFPYTSQFLRLNNGAHVHYVDEGEGPVLLLLHGNPAWSFLYRKIIENLKSRFRCIALDYPGFGLSTAPEGYHFTPQEHSQVVEEFVDALHLRNITIMVQDWGGPIGFDFAIRRPELVDRFIVGNTWAWPLQTTRRVMVFSRIMGGPAGRLASNLFNGVVRFFFSRGVKSSLTRSEMNMYLAPFRRRRDRMPAHKFPRLLELAKDFHAGIERNFHAISDRPALIVWGQHDFAFKAAERQRFEALFRDHETVLLEEAGHFIQEDAAQEISGAIDDWIPAAQGHEISAA